MPTLHDTVLDALTSAALACPAQDIVLTHLTNGSGIAMPANHAMSFHTSGPALQLLFRPAAVDHRPVHPDPVVTIDTLTAATTHTPSPLPAPHPRAVPYDRTFSVPMLASLLFDTTTPPLPPRLEAAINLLTHHRRRNSLHTAEVALMARHPDPTSPTTSGMSTTLQPQPRGHNTPPRVLIH